MDRGLSGRDPPDPTIVGKDLWMPPSTGLFSFRQPASAHASNLLRKWRKCAPGRAPARTQ